VLHLNTIKLRAGYHPDRDVAGKARNEMVKKAVQLTKDSDEVTSGGTERKGYFYTVAANRHLGASRAGVDVQKNAARALELVNLALEINPEHHGDLYHRMIALRLMGEYLEANKRRMNC